MNLFQNKGADDAYSKWQEPPSRHEEDGCELCHRGHLEKKNELEDCEFCREKFEMDIENE